jgi:hypothetical protein
MKSRIEASPGKKSSVYAEKGDCQLWHQCLQPRIEYELKAAEKTLAL